MAVRTHTDVSGGQSRDTIKAVAPLGQVSLLESASDDQRPADSHGLQVAAEGPVHLLLFTGSNDTLDKGQQRWGQLGPSTLQEGQDPHAVSGVPLRDEQHRLQRGSLQRSLEEPGPPSASLEAKPSQHHLSGSSYLLGMLGKVPEVVSHAEESPAKHAGRGWEVVVDDPRGVPDVQTLQTGGGGHWSTETASDIRDSSFRTNISEAYPE